MSVMTFVLLIGGLVVLVVGAEALVRGASRLAAALGISPLVIGLTVVAFGTSSPELAVSIQSALAGQADIALGNVVGSNIFNVLFILGLSAVITPLSWRSSCPAGRTDHDRRFGPAAAPGTRMGRIERWEGVLLFAGIVAYTAFQVWQARREEHPQSKRNMSTNMRRKNRGARATLVNLCWRWWAGAAGGGSKLVCGWRHPVARAFGVSELIIGLPLLPQALPCQR